MVKKLGILTAAIAVLAIAVPATASASALWNTNGELLPVGTYFTATSTNFNIYNGQPLPMPIECEEVLTENEITVNNGSSVEAVNRGEDTTADCFIERRYMERTTGIRWSNLNSTSSGSGTVKMFFETHWVGTCYYEGEVPFTYPPGSNRIHVSGEIGTVPASVCGPAYIEGDFILEQLSGEAILFL